MNHSELRKKLNMMMFNESKLRNTIATDNPSVEHNESTEEFNNKCEENKFTTRKGRVCKKPNYLRG